jgi:hypothetical protein
LLDAEDKVYE